MSRLENKGTSRYRSCAAMGFGAIVVAVGAQGTKWLGLPGEHLRGVYHAKDVIYYYNGLPPFSDQRFDIGKRVALIGVGNVMADIAHWLVRELQVDEVVAVARRGPAEVKFTTQELTYVAANLDLAALDQEIERVRDADGGRGPGPHGRKGVHPCRAAAGRGAHLRHATATSAFSPLPAASLAIVPGECPASRSRILRWC